MTLAAAIATMAAAAAPLTVPFVSVQAKLVRLLGPFGGVVTGRIVWNAAAVKAYGMSVGDLRLVAISDDADRPTLPASATYDKIATRPSQRVTMSIKRDHLHAIRPAIVSC